MMDYNQAILAAAGEYLGLKEYPGAKHNPQIVAMFKAVGHAHVADDETPWCAAFVGSVLASLGLPNTGKLNARSYEGYGAAVRTQDAKPGDIVVLWRGSRTGWQGHVAFFVAFDGGKILLRGGNQGDAVTDAAYSMDRVVCVRRADGAVAEGRRPVLRVGDKGAWVLDLQDQLVRHGYTLGRKDADYGSRTLGAVVAFQEENGLTPNGIVDDTVWNALRGAPLRAKRDVTLEDLKHGESRTITEVEKGKTNVKISSAGLGISYVGAQVQEVSSLVAQAEGIGDMLSGIAPHVLVLVAVGVIGYIIAMNFDRIAGIRLKDAQTGANDRI